MFFLQYFSYRNSPHARFIRIITFLKISYKWLLLNLSTISYEHNISNSTVEEQSNWIILMVQNNKSKFKYLHKQAHKSNGREQDEPEDQRSSEKFLYFKEGISHFLLYPDFDCLFVYARNVQWCYLYVFIKQNNKTQFIEIIQASKYRT